MISKQASRQNSEDKEVKEIRNEEEQKVEPCIEEESNSEAARIQRHRIKSLPKEEEKATNKPDKQPRYRQTRTVQS